MLRRPSHHAVRDLPRGVRYGESPGACFRLRPILSKTASLSWANALPLLLIAASTQGPWLLLPRLPNGAPGDWFVFEAGMWLARAAAIPFVVLLVVLYAAVITPPAPAFRRAAGSRSLFEDPHT